MPIDPVVMLAEELRIAERSLQEVRRANAGVYRLDRVEKANKLLARITRLHEQLFETEPASALGAGELVRLSAQHLPFSQSNYASHLNEIADRLSEGNRVLHVSGIDAEIVEGEVAHALGKQNGQRVGLLPHGRAGIPDARVVSARDNGQAVLHRLLEYVLVAKKERECHSEPLLHPCGMPSIQTPLAALPSSS